jgi:hypothetical protein
MKAASAQASAAHLTDTIHSTRLRPLLDRDLSLSPSAPDYFTCTPACADHVQLVMQQYALCPRAGYDVVGISELCNPDLFTAFESRLRQLQSRARKPAFKPNFASEAHAQQRTAVLDILRAHAEPFRDALYPDVTIVGAWHGTDTSIIPSIMSTSFANLAKTDSGFFGWSCVSCVECAAHTPSRQRHIYYPRRRVC